MLPQTFELPAAIVLVLAGAVACFAGYRLFRVVLAVYGFILGAMLASSLMGITNTAGMIAAGFVGGLVGALLFTFAYYVGIGILGASMAVFFVHVFWEYSKHADPPAVAVIVGSIAGAIVAMVLQRYVIILSTAFSGAWTMIVGAMAMAGHPVAQRMADPSPTGPMPNVWILYPFTPAPGQRWLPIAWLALGLFGVAVQFGVTGRKKF
jgi:Domain of unknown function (DUF4203)